MLILGFCLFSNSSSFGQTTKGNNFWLSFLPNLVTDSAFVIISSETADSVTVEIPGMSWSKKVYVAAGGLIRVFIPSSYRPTNILDTSNVKGIHVFSKVDISLYAISVANFSTDATCIYPSTSIPRFTKYIGTTAKPLFSYNKPLLGIVAEEDSTIVEITPANKLISGWDKNVSFRKTLNKGACYILTSIFDLTGSSIQVVNNKKAAVFGGDVCANIRCTACDHLFEQISPISTLGKRFIITPFYNQTKGFDYTIVATKPNTIIKRNGINVDTLKLAGDSYNEAFGYDSTLCIETSHPTQIIQFMTGITCNTPVGGDPAMLSINPNEQMIGEAIVSTANTGVINTHYINIIIPKKGLARCFLDGTAISQSSFKQIYCGDYYFYSSTVSPGNHSIKCIDGFISYVYGIGSAESYAYGAGASLKNLNRFATYQFIPNCDTNYIVQLTSQGDSATRFKWTFSDGTVDTAKSPIKSFSSLGTKTIQLNYFLYETKKWDSAQLEIVLESKEIKDFITINSLLVCDTVYTLTLPVSKIFKYTWQNGDTQTYFVAKKTGKYKVKIKNNISGCEIYDSCFLTFKDKVYPDFNIINKQACPKELITLRDTSKVTNDTILSYNWYIDFFKESSAKNYQFISRPNNYDLKLVVTTKNGCSDSIQKKYLVSDIPVPKFVWNKKDTCMYSNQFIGTSISYILVGSITKVKWLFENGDSAFGNRLIKRFAPKDTGNHSVKMVAYSESGCKDTSNKITFKVYPAPEAKTALIDSIACLSSNYFQFANLSKQDSTNRSYVWEYSDGTGQTFNNPTRKSFADTGKYTVSFVAINKKTLCSDTTSRTVTVIPNLKASFTKDSFEYCKKDNFVKVSITSSLSSKIKYRFIWGDGTFTDSVKTYKKRYLNPGSYSIRLAASAGKGCNDTAKAAMIVYNNATGDFSISDSNNCGVYNYFNIQNNSLNTIGSTRYNWYFGDGNTSLLKAPGKHSYSTFGDYKIKLVLIDPLYGCKDSTIRNVKVYPTPNAKIYCQDTLKCLVSDTFNFSDTGSKKEFYSWTFDANKADTASGKSVKRKFNTIGKHSIQLNCGSLAGCKDSTSINVFIKYPDSIGFIQQRLSSNCAPTKADYVWKSNYTNWNYTWKSNAITLTDADSTKFNYSIAKNYKLNLKITDNDNCVFEDSVITKVLPKPTLSIVNNSKDLQCLKGNKFDLEATEINATKPLKYSWFINNVLQTKTTQNITETFSDSGNYTFRVGLVDSNNCGDTSINIPAKVIKNLQPDFTINGACENLSANILSTGVQNATKLSWFLDGKLASSNPAVSIKYNNPGKHNLQLISELNYSSTTCIDSSVVKVYSVWPKPIVDYSYTISKPDSFSAIYSFVNNTQFANQYQWIENAKLFSGETNPQRRYLENADYEIKLIAQSDSGCTDSTLKTFKVRFTEYLFIPTAYIPSKEIISKTFKPAQISTTTEYKMVIFNRWGAKIFESNDPKVGWNGTYMGSQVMDGVYVYRIHGRFLSGKRFVESGNLTLFK